VRRSEVAIEFFGSDGSNFLLVFHKSERDDVYNKYA
jgi:hypothetical protein